MHGNSKKVEQSNSSSALSDQRFVESVGQLNMRSMGTEAVAPLLYSLVRMIRPSVVLEVGMGYTTPYLARALVDNAAEVDAEVRSGHPGLTNQDFYATPYRPTLICIDRMSDLTSSAPRVQCVLDELGLATVCTVLEGDLRECADDVRRLAETVDFAWVDTWDTLAFLRHYWQLIDPAGGMLAVHYLLTYPEGRAVLRYLEALQRLDGKRVEITNLREPHKRRQNSLTLVRRVRDYEDPEDLRTVG